MPGVPGWTAITGLSTAVVTSSAAAIIIRYIMVLMSFLGLAFATMRG
jgi:hypothetical protein